METSQRISLVVLLIGIIGSVGFWTATGIIGHQINSQPITKADCFYQVESWRYDNGMMYQCSLVYEVLPNITDENVIFCSNGVSNHTVKCYIATQNGQYQAFLKKIKAQCYTYDSSNKCQTLHMMCVGGVIFSIILLVGLLFSCNSILCRRRPINRPIEMEMQPLIN